MKDIHDKNGLGYGVFFGKVEAQLATGGVSKSAKAPILLSDSNSGKTTVIKGALAIFSRAPHGEILLKPALDGTYNMAEFYEVSLRPNFMKFEIKPPFMK